MTETKVKSYFEVLDEEVDRGMHGRNEGLSFGFPKLDKYVTLRKATQYLFGGYTGCLSGDTIIQVCRKTTTANTKDFTIEQLYQKFHNLVKNRGWKDGYVTRVKVFKPDLGCTGLHEVEDVYQSGIKPVYQLTTNTGKKIKATKDHRFMISQHMGEDAFKRLEDLRVGDQIVCKAPKESRKTGRKLKNRKEIRGKFPYYWTARVDRSTGYTYQRVYEYRAAYDAKVNDITIKELISITSTKADHQLLLSDPKMVVHHKDENPLNNHPDNLELMTKRQHDTHHAKTSNYGHSWVQYEQIVDIQYVGEEMTYDISMKAPYHNFLANNILTHNSAKTTCADEIFVLNPIDEMLRMKKDVSKFKVIYWSMERKKAFKFARWFSRKCFLDHGIRIPMNRLLGWVRKEDRLKADEHDLWKMYQDYFDMLEETVIVIDGRQTPTGIRKYFKETMAKYGKMHEVSEYQKVFEYFDDRTLILQMFDHVGKLKMEGRMSSSKELIDNFSDDTSNNYRDLYGTSQVIVSQFNRSISNPMRLKQDDVTPMLEDFKSTSDIAEDSDVVMSIFDPWRYKVADPSGYNLDALRDEEGRKYYRNFQILKNSYGAEDIRIGLAFEPSMGIMREMPSKPFGEDLHPKIYEEIKNGSYFLPNH